MEACSGILIYEQKNNPCLLNFRKTWCKYKLYIAACRIAIAIMNECKKLYETHQS